MRTTEKKKGFEMKIADVVVGQRTLVENNNNDSLQVLYSEWQKQSWIEKNGNVDVVYDEELKRYTVPAFAESRKRYSDAKAIDCARFGSN
jgi:hypothetical protein